MPNTAAVDESLAAALLKNTAFTGPAVIWASLHTADPAGTGASELTTGTGTNGRQSVAWTGSGGVENPSATVTYSGFAVNSLITHVGFWSAQTAGTFQGGYPLMTGYRSFTALAAAALFTSPAHGLTATTKIRFLAAPQQGTPLPVGISPATGTFTDGVENTTTTLTSATAGFTAADVGLTITGTNIPAATTIASVTNATTIVMSAAATATASGITFSILNRGLYFVIAGGLTTDAFQVSLTSGGASIANLTAAGGGLWGLDRSVTILATSDQVQFATSALTYTQS